MNKFNESEIFTQEIHDLTHDMSEKEKENIVLIDKILKNDATDVFFEELSEFQVPTECKNVSPPDFNDTMKMVEFKINNMTQAELDIVSEGGKSLYR